MKQFLILICYIQICSILFGCAANSGAASNANTWCDCIKTAGVDSAKLRKCDQMASEYIKVLLTEKWKEIQNKGLSPDSMEKYTKLYHEEMLMRTTKCREDAAR
jgi:hypothetical protein